MKKLLKNVFCAMLVAGFILPFTGCGKDTLDLSQTGGGASDDIALAAVSDDNLTTVTIPADFFGEDLSGATFDVFVNGTQVGTDLDPSDSAFFDATTNTIDFAIQSINDGDIVNIDITDVNGVKDSFSATVSADAATFAVSVTE